MKWVLRGIFVCFTLAALGVLGGGIFLLVQRQTGTRADAKIAECHVVNSGNHATDECTGSWVVGGSLLNDGHVVVGDVQGAESRDVGKTLHVTVRGDTAYTRGFGLPIGLTAGGLVGTVGLGLLTIYTWSAAANTPSSSATARRPHNTGMNTTVPTPEEPST
jgi:hypothetical protein